VGPQTRRPHPAVETQYEILEAAAAHVYPGGFLAYSTCSLEMEENQEVAERFKKAHPSSRRALTLRPL
jgi:16S rRNA (cytosine967-C5)-methyltransferase